MPVISAVFPIRTLSPYDHPKHRQLDIPSEPDRKATIRWEEPVLCLETSVKLGSRLF